MKAACAMAVSVLLAGAGNDALAQAYPAGSEMHRIVRSDRGPMGNLTVPGQIFPAALPLSPSSANPAVAAIGIFQAGTLAGNAQYAATAVCPADVASFLTDMSTDMAGAAQYLQGFPVREALGVFAWGTNYVVVLARLRNGSDVQMRHYPLRQLAPNRFCLTHDLSGDTILLQTAGLMLVNVNGQLY